MIRIKRLFAIFLISIAAILFFFIAGFYLITTLSLDTKFIKNKIESIASSELGRKVLIKGDIDLQYGFWPSIEINNIKIGNPAGWGTVSQFADIGNVRIQIGIIPLLKKQIKIREFSLNDVLINLEKSNAGENNWDMNPRSENTSDSNSEGHESLQNYLDNFEVKSILVRDLNVNYYDRHSDKTHNIDIESFEGSVISDQPIELDISGFYQKEPYNFKLTGGTVNELIDSDKSFQLKLQGDFLGSVLNIDGTINDPLELNEAKLSFSLEGNGIDNIENFLDLDLPNAEYYNLSGQAEISESVIQLYDLDAQFGDSKLNAEVTVDFSKQKPYLDGTINVINLDLMPFMEMSKEENDEESEPDFDKLFEPLGLFNANIKISIDQVTNLPVNINDISTRVEIRDNELIAPLVFNLEGVKLNGDLNLGLNDDIPTINLSLKSHNPDLYNILRLSGTQYINASLETLDFKLSGSGKQLSSVLESLEAKLIINNAAIYNESDTNEQSANIVNLGVIKIELDPQIGIAGSIQGEFSDAPILINLSACKAKTYINGNWCEVNLRANSVESRMTLEGKIKNTNSYMNTDLKLHLSANDLNDYRKFFADNTTEGIPLDLSMEVKTTKKEWSVNLSKFNLGNSELNGSYSSKLENGQLYEILTINSSMLDLNQLNELLPHGEERSDNSGNEGLNFDIPVFPTSVKSLNIDINIDIKSIAIGPSEFHGTDIYIQIVDGAVENSSFMTNIGKTNFDGQILIDFADENAIAHIVFTAYQVDIGSLFKDFEIHDSLYFKSEQIEVEINLTGSSLSEILYKSSLNVSVDNGEWIIYKDDNLGNIKVDNLKATINTQPNKPIMLHLTSTYGALPITVDIETDNIIRGLTRLEQKSPFELHAVIAGTDIKLSGSVAYPLGSKDAELTINISGNNVNNINDILGIDIPDIRPYHLSSNLLISGDNFQFKDVEFKVGDSTIKGNIGYVSTGEYQRLDIDLYSYSIELKDFMSEKLNNTDTANTKDSSKNESSDKQETPFGPIISMLKLRTMYAAINLNIEKIFYDNHLIGDLKLVGNLQNGQLKIDHFNINTPGGTIKNLISADFFQSTIKAEIVTRIENLDYSFLEKTLDTETHDGGILNLNLNLSSYGDDLYEFDDNSTGYVNINVVPRSIITKIFDIWATGIIVTILPNWSGKTKPKVNCLVGSIEFKNGIIDPKDLYIDTTNVRVKATGYIDLRNQRIRLLFKPIPKRPQLFNLGLPISVTGKFDNYTINPDFSKIGWYALRIVSFAGRYVLELFGKGILPEDGSDICGKFVTN